MKYKQTADSVYINRLNVYDPYLFYSPLGHIEKVFIGISRYNNLGCSKFVRNENHSSLLLDDLSFSLAVYHC